MEQYLRDMAIRYLIRPPVRSGLCGRQEVVRLAACLRETLFRIFRNFGMDVFGVDACQALHIAFKIAGTFLYMSRYHQAGQLVWLEKGQGYGFPVPANMTDLLVGHDRQLYGSV